MTTTASLVYTRMHLSRTPPSPRPLLPQLGIFVTNLIPTPAFTRLNYSPSRIIGNNGDKYIIVTDSLCCINGLKQLYPNHPNLSLSQSKASVLASRRDKERVVPDSDTGSYKRTMSPNGHAIPSEVLAESPKINSRETVWPNKNTKELLKNNNNSNLFRRVSMTEKPSKTKNRCEDNEDLKKNNLVLPDVLPVNAKLLSNRSHYSRPSHLNFSSLDDSGGDHVRKSPMKTPPSSPSKSPSRGSPFAPLRTTNLSSTTSFNSQTSPSNISTRIMPNVKNNSPGAISPNTPLKASSNCKVETSSPLTNQTPKPESPKMSPLQTKTLVNTSTNVSPPSSKRASPQIKAQLSPSASMKLSPLRLSPASSNTSSPLHASPLTTPAVSTPENSPPASPKKSEGCPQVVEGLQMIQRTEVILRVNTSTSDASSQTEKDELPPTPLPSRKKLQEEIECELLSEDLINHLNTSDRLKDLLVPGPTHKKSTDYVQGLFKPEVTARPRPVNSPFRSRCTTPSDCSSPCLTTTKATLSESTSQKSSVTSSVPTSPSGIEPTNSLPGNSAYFTISEPKAKFLTRYSQDMSQCQISRNTKDLNQKKEELVNRLGRKLEVLRTEQLAVDEEFKYNEELGENVESHISRLARPQEAAKFRLHVEEIGKITSLLLGLSGRLARAENALVGMAEDHPEKRTLEAKRDKLLSQLEEAKSLKESIDRRSISVSNILTQYLDSEEYADYDHFINMKAKLIMDSKEIADKIKLGEEQLSALKESLVT
ncbi:hypothetical protein HHI36_019831 [Cryptolaemus montrouzieri]|uniref:ASD2 domain-containing protein n=1 Tax=Cryptolaemus montrouzieri TaxID=559131 RepID=A0ABD2N9N4_9CUCU